MATMTTAEGVTWRVGTSRSVSSGGRTAEGIWVRGLAPTEPDVGGTTMAMGQGNQGLGVGQGARGSLGLDEGHHLGVRVGLQGIFQLLRVHRLTPGILHHDRHAPAALHVLDHAAAEDAVATDDDLVAGLHQIHEAGLHAHRAGAGNRESQRVLGLERITQQYFQFIHHAGERRIEMADHRLTQGGQHPRVHVGGPRPHQDTAGSMEGLEGIQV